MFGMRRDCSMTRSSLGAVAQARLAVVEEPLRNRSIRKGHGRNSRGPALLRHQTLHQEVPLRALRVNTSLFDNETFIGNLVDCV